MTIIPFDKSDFEWGQAGIPGTGISAGEKASINARLDALEAINPATTLAGLGDTSISSPSTGQLLRWNGTAWANYTMPATTVTFGIPFVMDGAGSVLSTGVWYSNVEIPFACTITGWTLVGSPTGSAVITVSRSTYGTHPTYTDISGTEKPTLAAQVKNQDLSLTTWTTSLNAGDLLRVNLDSVTSTTYLTLNLRLTRTI